MRRFIISLVCLSVTACATPNPPPLPPIPQSPDITPAARIDLQRMKVGVREMQILTCRELRRLHPIHYAFGYWRASCGR